MSKVMHIQLKKITCCVLGMGFVFGTSAYASLSKVPLSIVQSVDPRVLLVLSNDHQLYKKAYSDYHDLDNDGVIDTSYKDTVEYDGYFDPKKCYNYTTSGTDRFVPDSLATGTNAHECAGALWSGNFLNWATMTRMDMVRKTLYGGKRKEDPSSASSATILERAFLPKDVHAYVKTFQAGSGTEMQKYTPFSTATISFCNVSWSTSSTESQSLSVTPLLRVASGFWPFWAMSEVEQCAWGGRSERPSESSNGLGSKNYQVHIEVCDSSVGLEENCRQYPSGNIKPTGVLQSYGEGGDMQFGLLSGSYKKNRSGGVLRKNITDITDNSDSSLNEIAYSTTGQFINQGSTDGGIINTLNRFRISKYSSSSKKYNDCSSPGILESQLIEGNSSKGCSNWGNPLGEIYLEGLRYFAGASGPTSTFDTTDSSYIPSLPSISWQDPLPTNEYCAKNSIILMSTGINSFDNDGYSSASDISGLSSAKVNTMTDTVGTLEGISGNYLIGKNGTDNDEQCTAKSITHLSSVSGICPDAPTMDGGYQIAGLGYYGYTEDLRTGSSYPGDQTIRTYAMSLAERLPTLSIPVGGNMVNLVPHCEANSDGNASLGTSNWRACSIVDLIVADITYNGDNQPISGRFFIGWEDSTWGNDYDMDGVQELEFCVGSACSPSIDSDEIQISTGTPYAAAGHALLFGYVIAGTTDDGTKRLVIRRGGLNFNDWTNINTFENKFNDGNGGTSPTVPYDTAIYTESVLSASGRLKNPLWYTAKYSGFDDEDNDGTPAHSSGDAREWDADEDGSPDNYFSVTNFSELNDKLGTVLQTVLNLSTSSSSVVANSVRLETGTRIYQARYNSTDWSGELQSLPISSGVASNAEWQASEELDDLGQNERIIITTDPSTKDGIKFRWNSLDSAQKTALQTHPISGTVESTTVGESRLDYLRGERGDEQQNGGAFRDRGSKLGDIVYSSPYYVGSPSFSYTDTFEASAYSSFQSTYKSRIPMVYVGANDGMLHGFNANTGEELLAFIPNRLFSGLNELTSTDYIHEYFVDGSPTSGDVYIGSAWKSVLVGGYRAGGQGYYALDVTNPGGFTEDNAANIVLWEFTDADDADLGYSFAQPAIVKMNNNKWAAVFGNGYQNTESDGHASTTGHASLFILFIEEGSDGTWSSGDYIKIDTESGVTGNPNGLTTVSPVDSNGDGKVDAIYAGDLYGNLWKFDVSAANTNTWDSAHKQGSTPKPLFVAEDSGGTAQPVTTRAEVGNHPDGGLMIYFGTGKYFETGDNDTSSYGTQTFYGVRDDGSNTVTRSQLVAQTVETTVSAFNELFRVTSDNAVNYSSKSGWYMDLPTTGEMITVDPILRGGHIIFVTTIPSTEPCDFGGTSWLMELDAVTGQRPTEPVFDANGDGVVNASDKITATIDGSVVTLPPAGQKSDEGLLTRPAILSDGDREIKFSSGSSGNVHSIVESPLLGAPGRRSWRQIWQ